MEKTTTSVPSWQSSLNLLLKQAANKADRSPRIVIMGIGNEMRADDAAGMLVARRLLEYECIRESERVRIILAEHAPENATWQLRGFAPHLVLLVDAAAMDERPGAVRWIEMEDIEGMSASTHSLPLSMLARYLVLEFNCPVVLLGIQPASTHFDGPCHPNVLQTVDAIVNEIVDRVCESEFPH